MDIDAFRASLAQPAPPAGLPLVLQALWWDAKGDWDRAHDCAQAQDTRATAAIHAYLHRKEGDPGNARYWYGRAGRPAHGGSLDAEWQELLTEFLAAG